MQRSNSVLHKLSTGERRQTRENICMSVCVWNLDDLRQGTEKEAVRHHRAR